MTPTPPEGRYRLLAVASEAPDGVILWHAHDDVLDRPVAIRVIPITHPQLEPALTAAQVAATVDDRRLLRVLDIIDIPGPGATDPGQAVPAPILARGIVSEWESGRTLAEVLDARQGTPMSTGDSLDLVTDVARAIAAGSSHGLGHGRLRPSSVLISEVGETRVRGLGVDSALRGLAVSSDGTIAPDIAAADVDALGALTYLLTTGYWPRTGVEGVPAAPIAGGAVLPPSQVRATVPRGVDDLVARSLAAAAPARGRDRLPDAAAFAALAGAALDHVAPVTTATMRPVSVGPASPARLALRIGARLLVVAAALVLTAGIAWVGWQLLAAASSDDVVAEAGTEGILTSPATPVDDLPVIGVTEAFDIVGYRSYDPYGDDNGNEKPDRRKGRENEDLAVTVNDVDPDTAWLTSQYGTADLDGKPGVGLILDLGVTRDVQEATLNLVGRGTALDVRVADSVLRDPALWTPLASGFAQSDRIQVRAPRPVPGRFVLLWLTQLPPVEGGEEFQGGVRSVSIT